MSRVSAWIVEQFGWSLCPHVNSTSVAQYIIPVHQRIFLVFIPLGVNNLFVQVNLVGTLYGFGKLFYYKLRGLYLSTMYAILIFSDNFFDNKSSKVHNLLYTIITHDIPIVTKFISHRWYLYYGNRWHIADLEKIQMGYILLTKVFFFYKEIMGQISKFK